jgi:hypothetical protein
MSRRQTAPALHSAAKNRATVRYCRGKSGFSFGELSVGEADKEATLRDDTLKCAVLRRPRPNCEGEEPILLALLV